MAYSKQRLREVAAIRKAAVQRIRTQIYEIDTSPSLKYIEEFTSEFADFEKVCSRDEVLNAAAKANLIWLGDYHVLADYQAFAEHFIRELAGIKPNLTLGLEPIFARHQRFLDRWMKGDISEQEFLAGIRYEEEWGCDWTGYRAILTAARELGIPVFGVDCHPRYDMRRIGRRDQGTALRISRIIESNPTQTLVVLFGESHLASTHLPGRVRSILQAKNILRREILILQNVDQLYWTVQEEGREGVEAVKIKNDQYCVFNATPIEKYESFRQYLHRCIDEDASGTWTDFVHTLIDVMIEFVDPKRNYEIADQLPKVYAGIPPARLPQFLARQAIPWTQVKMALDAMCESGTFYVPALNSIFIDRLHVGAATEESTRFIHQACRGDLLKSADRAAPDQFFVMVIERALGYFCSKLLDSSRDGIEALSKRVLEQIGYNEQLTRAVASLLNPARRPAGQHFETLRAAIGAASRSGKTMHMLGQLLGYTLGQSLYEAFLQSRISRKEIQALFRDPLDQPDGPMECYRKLTERLS
jgi:hypothetical protein